MAGEGGGVAGEGGGVAGEGVSGGRAGEGGRAPTLDPPLECVFAI